jgi:hypothetical protein
MFFYIVFAVFTINTKETSKRMTMGVLSLISFKKPFLRHTVPLATNCQSFFE